jgi:hypothetical protein
MTLWANNISFGTMEVKCSGRLILEDEFRLNEKENAPWN